MKRARSVGQRVDHVTLDSRALEPSGFDGAVYREQATLARQALDLLARAGEASPTDRRSILEEAAEFYDFLAQKMPDLLTEWHAKRGRPGPSGETP